MHKMIFKGVITRKLRNSIRFFLLLAFVSAGVPVSAQGDSLSKARAMVSMKNYQDAVEIYRSLYERDPSPEIYDEYFDVLIFNKEYKDAEKVLKRTPQPPSMVSIGLGRIELAQGKNKKAEEHFDNAILALNGDEMVTTRVANAFKALERNDYLIRTYERARELSGNPYLYGEQLGRLYAATGDMEKAVVTLITSVPWQQGGIDATKATLLEVLGSDHKKMLQTQKILIKKINEQPDNQNFPELLTWLYTQKGDWEGALIQIVAIDERNRETGDRLLGFGRYAHREGQYEIAIKSFDAVLEKGKDKPFYSTAAAEKLAVQLEQLENNPAYTQDDVKALAAAYETLLKEYPHFYMTELPRDYAKVEAQYNNNPQKGIDILQAVLDQPRSRKDLVGWAKLQMGDYYVLQGKVWDASLLYSQVDKSSREDMLGEEARYRNAKLSYYRGDFKWAQGQLSVLKASTSELIANDALYLSVLITENTPDSNFEALNRFAYADLLLFQNKYKEATTLLDSIATAYPEHSLNDDILMLHAKIAEKHRDYTKALDYLKQLSEKYGEDVLGDDAMFRSAEIYEKKLNKPGEAKKLYEDLIMKYQESTYILTARKRVAELEKAAPPMP